MAAHTCFIKGDSAIFEYSVPGEVGGDSCRPEVCVKMASGLPAGRSRKCAGEPVCQDCASGVPSAFHTAGAGTELQHALGCVSSWLFLFNVFMTFHVLQQLGKLAFGWVCACESNLV